GGVDTANYVVTDTLPEHATFVSSSGDCLEGANANPMCTLGAIPAGTEKRYTFTVSIDPTASVSVYNNISGRDVAGDAGIVTRRTHRTSVIQDADGDAIPDEWDDTPSTQNPNFCSGADIDLGLLIVPAGQQVFCRASNSITTTPADSWTAQVLDGGSLSLMAPVISFNSGFQVADGGHLQTVVGNIANYHMPGSTPRALQVAGSVEVESPQRHEVTDSMVPVPRRLLANELPLALQNRIRALGDLPESAYSDEGGNHIVFASELPLTAGDDNGLSDVYLYITAEQALYRLSQSAQGVAGNGASWEPVINGYGDRVLYTTTASNLLVETDTNSVSDIILYHIDSGLSERISRTEEGEEMTTAARHPSLSGDGSVAAYEVGDKETYRQIYLARLDSSGTSILSPVSSHD
ncbi:MAG: DUF11 domain-containing protein, partial [Chromatiales bacterium]|nr:DUF11 domain-containing protein [Chromatiales bacterium]